MTDLGPLPLDTAPTDAAGLSPAQMLETPGTEGPEREFTVQARSQWRMVLRRFLHHKLAVSALVVLILMVLLAFLGPPAWQYTPTDQSSLPFLHPSTTHPFGTDQLGEDMFAQNLAGLRITMAICLITAAMSALLGTLIGSVAGYYRRWADFGLMRLCDLVLVLPYLVIFAVVARKFQNAGWWGIALVLGFILWVPMARLVRGVFLSLREKEFVEAARALGASDFRIIWRHLLPNAVGPIIVNATIVTALAVLVETAASYLGLGVKYPDTSLGLLISNFQTEATAGGHWWLFYFPGLLILIICLSVNFLGDGLRDALDPTQRVRA